MTYQILLVLIFTFVIHLIGTLSYAIRLVGLTTGRIAVASALFNILVILVRIATTLQAPLLAKTIEHGISVGQAADPIIDFRWILFSAFLATVIGALAIPTFRKLYEKAVVNFSTHRSFIKLIIHGLTHTGVTQVKEAIQLPAASTVEFIKNFRSFPYRIIIINIIAVAFLTTGVLSSLYAGYLAPEIRTTAFAIGPVVAGAATVMLLIMVDPYLSLVADDIIAGRVPIRAYYRYVTFIIIARIIGTALAQIAFVPAAKLILILARLL